MPAYVDRQQSEIDSNWFQVHIAIVCYQNPFSFITNLILTSLCSICVVYNFLYPPPFLISAVWYEPIWTSILEPKLSELHNLHICLMGYLKWNLVLLFSEYSRDPFISSLMGYLKLNYLYVVFWILAWPVYLKLQFLFSPFVWTVHLKLFVLFEPFRDEGLELSVECNAIRTKPIHLLGRVFVNNMPHETKIY